jgi:predicted DNA-binding protein
MKRKAPMTLNLEVNQIEKLEKAAEQSDRSVSKVVREAVDKYLEESAAH